MDNIIAASPTQHPVLATMDTATLRRELSAALQISARQLVYLAAVWKELESRGEDLSKLKIGMGEYLPMIASGTLSAEAVVRYAGNRVLLNAIASLNPEEQEKLLDNGHIDIASISEQGDIITTSVPIDALRTQQIRQLFRGGKILNTLEQVKALPVRTEPTEEQADEHIETVPLLPPEDTVVKKARDIDVENGFVVIGRYAIPADDVLKVLRQHNLLTGKKDKTEKRNTSSRWTEKENDILRAYYLEEGIKVRDRLPGRTDPAIFVQAGKLGLKRREG